MAVFLVSEKIFFIFFDYTNRGVLLIPIHRVDVLRQRLFIMARFTKALPVASVPE